MKTRLEILQNSIIQVNKEILNSTSDVYFESEMKKSSELLDIISNDYKYLWITAEITTNESKANISFFYNAKIALAIEYFMLMGQIEFDENLIITDATVDATQEFLHMIIKKTTTEIENNELGQIKIDIKEIKVVDNAIDIDLDLYRYYNIYMWEQELNDIKIDETVYILYDIVANELFKPKINIKEPIPLNNIKNNPINQNFNTDNVTIEIEDCDNRKKIYREELDNLKLLLGVELKLSVRIGSKKMLLKDVVNIDIGTTIELEQLASEPLEILVNEIKIAEGEIVVVNGKFGVQITKISSKVERLTKLRFKV